MKTLIFFADAFIVRATRSRIIYLRNDYKALMNVIEKVIHDHFANQAQLNSEPAANVGERPAEVLPLTSRPVAPLENPFAIVNSVIEGSPADTAGLKLGDEIRNFGYVNWSNSDGLKRVAECVQGNEGVGSLQLQSSLELRFSYTI